MPGRVLAPDRVRQSMARKSMLFVPFMLRLLVHPGTRVMCFARVLRFGVLRLDGDARVASASRARACQVRRAARATRHRAEFGRGERGVGSYAVEQGKDERHRQSCSGD